jgi:UDP-2,4-diacetamido-2,4,6-trideoxy-beta-L-altropyranose hydrolase
VKIKIRAEGGSQIGFGHWSRCLFLVSCVNQEIDKTLYTFNSTEFEQFFPKSGINVVSLRSEEEFIDSISSEDILLIDGYRFNGAYLNLFKNRKPLIVYIDDLLYTGLNADVIINHCLGITTTHYINSSLSASFFLGGDYSLVKVDSDINKHFGIDRLTTLMLAMGGADPYNFTSQILRDHDKWINTFKKIIIVIGRTHPSVEELSKYASLNENVTLYISISKQEVCNLMKSAGVAILSSSTMALEYAHITGLMGIIQTAENQKNLFQGLLDNQVAVNLKDLVKAENLVDLHNKNVSAQKKIFDGLSANRFKKLFKELEIQRKIRLRRGVIADTEQTFKWVSSASIRRFSFSQREILWEEHKAWYEKKILDSGTFYFIAEIDSNACGSIRFDAIGEELIVSYLVDPSWQGRGVGRALLAEGIKEIQKINLQVNVLVGYVMEVNLASIRIFNRMGFRQIASEEYPLSIKFYKKLK